MLHLTSCLALLAATAKSDSLDFGEETGEILLFSSAPTGFNNFVETSGSLDDVECFLKSTFFGNCKTDLSDRIRQGSKKVEDPIVVNYFVDEVYTNNDLTVFKEQYGNTNYNYVDILGLSLETGSQYYHRIYKLVRQYRYRQYPQNFTHFKNEFKTNKKLIFFEVDTISNALALSQKVNNLIESESPRHNVISVIAPAKATWNDFSVHRSLLATNSSGNSSFYNYSVCNTSAGDYCIEYQCDRTDWDSQAYSDSCIDNYDLLAILLFIFLFLPFCCAGCCCIDDIQTPLRFPSRVLPVGKEF